MSSLTNKGFLYIILSAFGKMNPRYLMHNPMFAIVFVVACVASILFLKEVNLANGHISLYGQMTFWIWMTLFFATLADSYAESKMPPSAMHLNRKNHNLLVKKLRKIDDLENFQEVAHDKIRSGNLLLLSSGDVVPFDGTIKAGMCYVNETGITGELGSSLKTPDGNKILIAGSIIEGGDLVVMKVSFSKRFSFFARSKTLLKGISRQSLPSELALQRIIMGLSVLFISVIFAVWVIARYSGFNIPAIYLLDLVVILLPTTISGLQYAIITFGKAKLAKSGIIVHDHVALDNVVDVNIILLDKTGTLTVGKREMTEFELTSDVSKNDYMFYLLLSSLKDSTHEGKSIKSYAEKHQSLDIKSIDRGSYKNLPFTPSNPISGCDYEGLEIRKGSAKAIATYLGKSMGSLPDNVHTAIQRIAKARGTPVLLAVNKEIIGVVHLRDRFRKGIMKQIKKLQEGGAAIIMITGDNKLTATYVANKLGIKESYAEATPERKLEFIRKLQQKGYVVAMCGDGANDALALAQADIGFTFEDNSDISSVMAGNIVAKNKGLSALIELKNVCKKMTVKRGALTVFSLASDVAKYFVIVPALFTTAFPPLAVLNFMNFHSLESVVLASVIFNALVIMVLTPLLFKDFASHKSKYSLWSSILFYGVGGIVSPFIFIKLIEIFILYVGFV